MEADVAYCWEDGQIEFGQNCPDDALLIAEGEPKALHEAVDILAVHGEDDQLLLPKSFGSLVAELEGIPDSALGDFIKFRRLVRARLTSKGDFYE